jgi:N-acetylglucosaminyldiphosphoundecaprenol N-acetyl-beta-D-mannosaminyltransferase
MPGDRKDALEKTYLGRFAPPNSINKITICTSDMYPYQILGTRIDPTSYEAATALIVGWSKSRQGRYVCAANVHMVMEAFDSIEFQSVVNQADLVTPDGMPLVWSLRMLGARGQSRVYGPDLTFHVVKAAEEAGIPIGFYGGDPVNLEKMIFVLNAIHPDLKVAYQFSPPFRQLSAKEDDLIVSQINESGARILFVGLGCPKQERWMFAHRDRIPLVMLGVGAAFDFIAGSKRQSPNLLQRMGLEWLFRFLQEPRRLWRRYLYQNPRFLWHVLIQFVSGCKG